MTEKTMFARCFIPTYALSGCDPKSGWMDIDYTPWVITHEDHNMLKDEILIPIWEMVYAQEDEDALEEFCCALDNMGYKTCVVTEKWLVLEV